MAKLGVSFPPRSSAAPPTCAKLRSCLQIAAAVLVAAGPGTAPAAVNVSTCQGAAAKTVVSGAEGLVADYLKAVDRGELTVFDQVLDRSMIDPLRIEYSIEIVLGTTKAKVHSRLRNPVPIPKGGKARIFAVSATVDCGSIGEIELHADFPP